jgi:hypothetical protein
MNRTYTKRLLPLVTGAALPASLLLAAAMPRPALFAVDGGQGRCLIGANGTPEAIWGGLDVIQAPGATVGTATDGSWIRAFSVVDAGAASHKAVFSGVILDGLGNVAPGVAVELVAKATKPTTTIDGFAVDEDGIGFFGYAAGEDGAVVLAKSKALTGIWGGAITINGGGTLKYALRIGAVTYFGSIVLA